LFTLIEGTVLTVTQYFVSFVETLVDRSRNGHVVNVKCDDVCHSFKLSGPRSSGRIEID
jgi:hypothetical protein